MRKTVFVILCFSGVLTGCGSAKEIDPEMFNFRQYETAEEAERTLKAHFPVGSPAAPLIAELAKVATEPVPKPRRTEVLRRDVIQQQLAKPEPRPSRKIIPADLRIITFYTFGMFYSLPNGDRDQWVVRLLVDEGGMIDRMEVRLYFAGPHFWDRGVPFRFENFWPSHEGRDIKHAMLSRLGDSPGIDQVEAFMASVGAHRYNIGNELGLLHYRYEYTENEANDLWSLIHWSESKWLISWSFDGDGKFVELTVKR